MPRSLFDPNLAGDVSPSDVDEETAAAALGFYGGAVRGSVALAFVVANVRRNVEAECEARFRERMRRVGMWSRDVRAGLAMQPTAHEARTAGTILRDAIEVADAIAAERDRRFGQKGE